MNSQFVGLCSGYSEGLSPLKDTTRIFIRNSSFRLPSNIETPITMIGPGTGIAPMRALIQERYYQSLYGLTIASGANDTNTTGTSTKPLRSRSTSGGAIKRTNQSKKLVPGSHPVGHNTLYFGCKNSKDDFIYKDELIDYRDNKKILHTLHLAFSRENPKKKVCVCMCMCKCIYVCDCVVVCIRPLCYLILCLSVGICSEFIG